MGVRPTKALRQLAQIDSYFTGFVLCRQEDRPCLSWTAALAAVAKRIAACNACQLGPSRTTTVPGEGNPDSGIMLVGEAPGIEEDLQGRPFIGKAGQLLDRILQACHLDRTRIFITNVIKCRPPNNRPPRPEEISACVPFLYEQIRIVQPRLLIALGAHAARTLLKSDRTIGQLRGRPHLCQIEGCQGPINLVATYHPSHLLRNYTYENRKAVWEDMKLAMRLAGLEGPTGGP
ncbi:MAG: uracil-DNA glycosylase [Sedimentisphaerales bacterium]|jgi:DNA polymerase|nr:uracil-DNA glycosylase [Sedimentisphaerales bacterium]